MAPSLSRGISFVYILRLHSGSIYVGCSSDAEDRFHRHSTGTACRATALDRAMCVVYLEIHADFCAARRREAQIKKMVAS